jgi:hypothetical protein
MVRARGRCEVCGVAVHGLPIPHKELSFDPRSEITTEELHRYLRDHVFTNVYLTCSHWYDPAKENLSADNLHAACQACHNGRDRPCRARNAAETRRRKADALLGGTDEVL